MTLRLRALSIGGGVPVRDFDARVHSSFQHAANLRLSESEPLLTILSAEQADLPQGIRTDVPAGHTFQGLLEGTPARSRRGLLTVGDDLVIDLAAGRTWVCDLPAMQAVPADGSVAAAWNAAWDTLTASPGFLGSDEQSNASVGCPPSHDPLMAAQMGNAVCEILDATRCCDPTRMASLERLIGLGPGLTPAGDDFVVGYLAGLQCSIGGLPERRAFVSAACKTVLDLSARTTDISRTFLYYAALGQISSRLSDLAALIARGAGSGRVSAGAQAAIETGHTSGAAAVGGLLLAMAAWNPELKWRVSGSRTALAC